MRIAIVEPHLELYGGIRRILELSNRLVDLGEDVTIFHPSGEPCRWMEGRAVTRRLDELAGEHFDVLLFNDPPDYRVARKAKADLKVYYVLDLAEHEKLKKFTPKIFWRKKGRTLSIKRALQLPFLKIANASWMQSFIRDELGYECELVLGGVNPNVFHPVERSPTEGGFRILHSGDPRERKGSDTVEAAMKIVRKGFPDVVLDSYHGKGIRQEDMAGVYSKADLFVDAQQYAGWNNPVAEAMACGVPVVCTDIGGVADFALHDKTALLVPVGNALATAQAIMVMITDEERRQRLRRSALEQIARFDWDDSARGLQAILQRHLVHAS